ncbi:hypothetical protein AAFF_G00046800 [Aldrovandia affinis]|uniref:Uncharacterized protein n=1 Tax=Aldrovandia affinis TaxID=143900 RepID=A0AAD7WFW0_9TELE|nr:hypothetical protein AAFF_G00046800 [Aldrovandia affinis]
MYLVEISVEYGDLEDVRGLRRQNAGTPQLHLRGTWERALCGARRSCKTYLRVALNSRVGPWCRRLSRVESERRMPQRPACSTTRFYTCSVYLSK